MSKGSTQTSTYSVPPAEQAAWTSLLNQTNSQTNADIGSENYPGLVSQINGSSSNILNNQVNTPALQEGIGSAGSASWTAPGTASSFMSPYENTALASQVGLNKSTLLDPELASIDQGAAASGALGGDRSQVLKSQAINNFNQNQSNVIAQGENTAYQTGENAYETEAARNLAAQEASAQTGISGAQSNVNTNLAATQDLLSGISASEAPEQQLATESGVLANQPKQGTTTGTTTPNGGVWGGIVSGLGTAAGTLLNGVGKGIGAGLKTGGYVDNGATGIGSGIPTKKTRRLKKKKGKK